MKKNTALKKLKPLLHIASFTSESARLRGVSSATLAYYVKRNELKRIGHGVYRSTKYAPSAEDFRYDDLIEAMQPDCILDYSEQNE
jgi:hypothetical protein